MLLAWTCLVPFRLEGYNQCCVLLPMLPSLPRLCWRGLGNSRVHLKSACSKCALSPSPSQNRCPPTSGSVLIMINTFTLAPFQDHAHQYFPSHLEVDFFNIYLVIFWTALPHGHWPRLPTIIWKVLNMWGWVESMTEVNLACSLVGPVPSRVSALHWENILRVVDKDGPEQGSI